MSQQPSVALLHQCYMFKFNNSLINYQLHLSVGLSFFLFQSHLANAHGFSSCKSFNIYAIRSFITSLAMSKADVGHPGTY